MYWKLAYEKTRFLNYRDGKIRAKCSPLSRLRKNSSIHWTVTWFWSCAVACLTVVAHTQARSIQPKFPEISVQNSMDQFGPTGKVSKKLVQLLRWNYGWIVVEWIAPVVRSRRILNSLLTTQLTTDWLPTFSAGIWRNWQFISFSLSCPRFHWLNSCLDEHS